MYCTEPVTLILRPVEVMASCMYCTEPLMLILTRVEVDGGHHGDLGDGRQRLGVRIVRLQVEPQDLRPVGVHQEEVHACRDTGLVHFRVTCVL